MLPMWSVRKFGRSLENVKIGWHGSTRCQSPSSKAKHNGYVWKWPNIWLSTRDLCLISGGWTCARRPLDPNNQKPWYNWPLPQLKLGFLLLYWFNQGLIWLTDAKSVYYARYIIKSVDVFPICCHYKVQFFY